MAAHKEHLSMLRSYTQADFFTLANGASGIISIFLCLKYLTEGGNSYLWIAFLLLFAALGFDIMDGYWSRKSGRQSILGADLDSLADVVSFGVAPAVLGFTLGLRGAWDIVILVYFVVCGISRLARFNATAAALSTESGKVKYFEGTPIPTSILIVVLWVVAFQTNAIHGALWLGGYQIGPAMFHPLTLIYAISGSAMISATLRFPKP